MKTIAQLINESEMWKPSFSHIGRVRLPRVYAYVTVASCRPEWWYKDLVGLEIFCCLDFELREHNGSKVLTKVIPVRLTNTRVFEGRDFDPADIIL